jgi:hypothetical protein
MVEEINIVIFFPVEGELYYMENGRQHQSLINGKRPQVFGKWKTNSIFSQSKMTQLLWQMGQNLND